MTKKVSKIAFVHDRLIFPWGAEKVFFDIIKDTLNQSWYYKVLTQNYSITKPSAKIFTTFYNPDFKLDIDLPVESVIKSKKVHKFSRQLLPIYPLLQKILSAKIRKFNPDLVIISSFAIWKNLSLWKIPKILYLHSPMQYIRSHYQEYLQNPYFKNPVKKLIFQLSAKYLRKWDKQFIKFDKIFFNSFYTKKTFEKNYNVSTNYPVLYPFVEIPDFKPVNIFKKYNLPQKYYLYIWRVVKFVKKLDKIINFFNQTGENLVIVWDWPDLEELKKIAKPNIRFLGYIPSNNDDYWNLLKNSYALINLTKESFWIVNYQALKLDKVVICKPQWAIKEMKGKKIYLDI